MIDNTNNNYPEGHTSLDTQQEPVSKPLPKGSIVKHWITAIVGLPVIFIVLMVVSSIALALNPAMIEAIMAGESLSTEALLQDSSFVTVTMLLQCLVFIVIPLLAVLVLSGKKAFSMGEKGFLPKLGLPGTWDMKTTKTTANGILLGVLLFGVLQLIGFLSEKAGYPLGSSETSEMIGSSSAFMMFAIAALLVPIAEEVFFRGYLFGFLAHPMDAPGTWRKVSALVLSSVIFGLMHFQGLSTFTDIFILVWITIVGFVFGLAYLRTGNLMTAIGAHVGYNGISSVSMFLLL